MKSHGLLALFGALLMAPACASVDGVWMFELAAPKAAAECEPEATDWNLIGANPPTETSSDWAVDESETLSNALLFAQLIKKGSNAVLLIDNVAYPSVEGSKGKTWTFEWTGSTQDVVQSSHVFGYACSEDVTTSSTVTYDLTIDGKFLTGTVASSDNLTAKYSESDRWTDEANGPDQCSIPFGTYLEILSSAGGGGGGAPSYEPAKNTQSQAECTSDPCTVVVEQRCSSSFDLVGSKVGLGPDASYDNVDDAGQAFGY